MKKILLTTVLGFCTFINAMIDNPEDAVYARDRYLCYLKNSGRTITIDDLDKYVSLLLDECDAYGFTIEEKFYSIDYILKNYAMAHVLNKELVIDVIKKYRSILLGNHQ